MDFLEGFKKKNSKISNLKKIRPVGDELFHAEGRTDRDITKPKISTSKQELRREKSKRRDWPFGQSTDKNSRVNPHGRARQGS